MSTVTVTGCVGPANQNHDCNCVSPVVGFAVTCATGSGVAAHTSATDGGAGGAAGAAAVGHNSCVGPTCTPPARQAHTAWQFPRRPEARESQSSEGYVGSAHSAD